MKKYFLIWLIVWLIIAVIVSAFGYSQVLGGIALAALISLIFMVKTLSDKWSGIVTEIRKEEVYSSGEDGGSTDIIEFAYIKLATGKSKRIQNLGWKTGDKLEKRQGEATIRVIS